MSLNTPYFSISVTTSEGVTQVDDNGHAVSRSFELQVPVGAIQSSVSSHGGEPASRPTDAGSPTGRLRYEAVYFPHPGGQESGGRERTTRSWHRLFVIAGKCLKAICYIVGRLRLLANLTVDNL